MKSLTKIILIIICTANTWLFATANTSANQGLGYLNALRTASGLAPFSAQSNLIDAAQNHSDYMNTNQSYGHGEDSSLPGYTGSSPSQRAIYAGYFSRKVGENVSYGRLTVEGSIDGLFSAIYHRFGFLSPSYDIIGIGINNNAYT